MSATARRPPSTRRTRETLRICVGVAVRQMFARRLLTAVAIGGVALGVLSLVTVSALLWGSAEQFERVVLGISPDVMIRDTELVDEARFTDGYAEAVIAHVAHGAPPTRDTRIKRPPDVLRALEALPEVEAAAPSIAGAALVRYASVTKSIELRGIEPAEEERVTPLSTLVVQGDWARLSAAAHGLALGEILARELGVGVGDVVQATTAAGRSVDFEVVAVFDSRIPAIDRLRGYAMLRDVQTLLQRPDSVGRIHVRLRDPKEAPAMAARFERRFGYDAESWQEANANFIGLMGVQRTVASTIMSGVLFLGGFGILAVQIMLVLQKQRDIAILRAVGFRRADILRVFLLHGVTMAVTGGLLGDVLAKLAIWFLGRIQVRMEGTFRADSILVADDFRMYASGFVFAVVMGILASVLPAWRASKVEPVDVLRGQIG